MRKKAIYRYIGVSIAAIILASCMSTRPPRQTTNICMLLAAHNSHWAPWSENWYKAIKDAERSYHIPAAIILATMNTESSFMAHARPPRRYILGFIPWSRISSAYGYAQALDGTWATYQRATGNYQAKRQSFKDSAYFIAWYHRQSVQKNQIRPTDAYRLYLNYVVGHGGYRKGLAYRDEALLKTAQKTEHVARSYAKQLKNCSL